MVYTLDMQLTKKQKLMLDFIDGFIKGNGYSPTLREIMRALGYKRSLVLCQAEKEAWWQNLVKEIKQREAVDDEKSRLEIEILKKALEIVRR